VFVVTLSPIISHVSSSSVLGYIMTPNICSFATSSRKKRNKRIREKGDTVGLYFQNVFFRKGKSQFFKETF